MRWRKSTISRFAQDLAALKDRRLGSREDREHVFYKFIFRKKTLFWAFLFWFGLRSFGGHFIYLERYPEALAYFIFVTLLLSLPIVYGFHPEGIGVLLLLRLGELIYLPILVKNSNKELEKRLKQEFGVET